MFKSRPERSLRSSVTPSCDATTAASFCAAGRSTPGLEDLVCGIAALVCSAVTVAVLGGKREQEEEIAMIESEVAIA